MKGKQMFLVDEKYQTNQLSHQLGGFVVGIKRSDGKVYTYPRVKNPKMYIEQAIEGGAVKGWVICKMKDLEKSKISNWKKLPKLSQKKLVKECK